MEVLQLALRSAFESQGLAFHEPRQRAFWPHLTVVRVATEQRPSRRPLAVHDLPDRPLPAGLREPFRAESVGLYLSELWPDGIRHRLLGRAELAAVPDR